MSIMRGPKAHSVNLTLEDGYLQARWTCHASEGADCRLDCPERCADWDSAYHQHELKDAGRCLVVEWLEEQGIEEAHRGTTVLYDGPIDTEWNDNGFVFWLESPPQGTSLDD